MPAEPAGCSEQGCELVNEERKWRKGKGVNERRRKHKEAGGEKGIEGGGLLTRLG